MRHSQKKADNGILLNLGISEKERQALIKRFKSLPRSVGQKYAIAWLNGEALTPKQAIQAHCLDCVGEIKDCRAYTCPLSDISAYTDKDYDGYDPERIQAILADYESNTVSSKGNSLYLKYLKGEELTHLQLIKARCAECTAGFADGRVDCGITSCCLHSYMLYRGRLK